MTVEFDCDPEWPTELDREVVSVLQALDEVVWHNEEQTDMDQWIEGPETPSGAPYDSCGDCVRREILTIAVNRTVEAVAAGRIRISA